MVSCPTQFRPRIFHNWFSCLCFRIGYNGSNGTIWFQCTLRTGIIVAQRWFGDATQASVKRLVAGHCARQRWSRSGQIHIAQNEVSKNGFCIRKWTVAKRYLFFLFFYLRRDEDRDKSCDHLKSSSSEESVRKRRPSGNISLNSQLSIFSQTTMSTELDTTHPPLRKYTNPFNRQVKKTILNLTLLFQLNRARSTAAATITSIDGIASNIVVVVTYVTSINATRTIETN